MIDKYFVFDRIDGDFEFYTTKKQAVEAAEKIMETYRDYAATDGWPEDFEIPGMVGMGEVMLVQKEKNRINRKDDPEYFDESYSTEWDYACEYDLEPVEAFDDKQK